MSTFRHEVTENNHSLFFYIDKKDILSSNRKEQHFTVSAKVKKLRKLGSDAGVFVRGADPQIMARFRAITERREQQTRKASMSRKLRKKGVSKEDVEHILESEFGNSTSYDSIPDAQYLFTDVDVRCEIGILSKAQFDPPNYWPTIKALMDGLTDASFWEDDNFSIINTVSFSPGEKSQEKGEYLIKLTFINRGEKI